MNLGIIKLKEYRKDKILRRLGSDVPIVSPSNHSVLFCFMKFDLIEWDVMRNIEIQRMPSVKSVKTDHRTRIVIH